MIIRSVTPDFLLVAFGISQISLSVIKLLLQNWSCAYFAWGFPKKRKLTLWYTIYKIDVIFGFFGFMNLLFEVVVIILISQLLTESAPIELTMQKPVFDGQFSKSHVCGGQFYTILGDFMDVNVKILRF